MRAAAILPAMIVAMTLPVQAAPAWIVGNWYGEGQPNDRSQMYIARLSPDGRFQAQHRACRKGKPVDQVQAGRWQLQGDLLTVTLVTVNGRPWPDTDVYRIVSHDALRQHYIYLRTQFSYTSHRVGADFKMPECDMVS